MDPFPGYITTANSQYWINTTSATTWAQPCVVPMATDWEKAAVKAEPDDEFSWLRRRVREIEELAFA